MAFENVEPSGSFGLYFNADVAGLSFLETLNKGLSSRGIASDNGMSRLLKSESRERERRHLAGADAFSMDQFLKFEVQRGSEDSAKV